MSKMRPHGETRGWQIKDSWGVPVLQFIQGGRYQPIPARP